MKRPAFLLGLRCFEIVSLIRSGRMPHHVLQILLVILFGAIEGACGCDLRRDGRLNLPLHPSPPAISWPPLPAPVNERNRRAILRAEIRPLAVDLRRVVSLPESVEQLFVTHFCRVKRHLHHFRMPRFVRANIFVVGFGVSPPLYPTAVSITPGTR